MSLDKQLRLPSPLPAYELTASLYLERDGPRLMMTKMNDILYARFASFGNARMQISNMHVLLPYVILPFGPFYVNIESRIGAQRNSYSLL